MDVLHAIKRLVLRGRMYFTRKAAAEMESDELDEVMVAEAIMSAREISKRIASTHPTTGKHEKLYTIEGLTHEGIVVYTKGKISKEEGEETFYVLISSKKSVSP
jgi:hypothetical protein